MYRKRPHVIFLLSSDGLFILGCECVHGRGRDGRTSDFFILLSVSLAHDLSVAPATPASLNTTRPTLKVLATIALVVKFPYGGASTDPPLDLLNDATYAFDLQTQTAGLVETIEPDSSHQSSLCCCCCYLPRCIGLSLLYLFHNSSTRLVQRRRLATITGLEYEVVEMMKH